MAENTVSRFKDWFWRPPRPHGETIVGRTVSALELLYDLVYVAIVGRAAHHLAEHVTARGLAEFAILFALIWMAWTNGSLYIELHGRQDGRTRLIVFVQMGILVLLAVFTADAASASGRAFAMVYALFLAVQAWLWETVRRQDLRGLRGRQDAPEILVVAGRYVTGLGLAAAAFLGSAFLPAGPRLLAWAAVALAWLGGMRLLLGRSGADLARSLPPTHALVERFGLFTIVVLGEVIFGVVNGLAAVEQDGVTIATGMLALRVGFGFWWVYFDFVGSRLPRVERGALADWMLSHLPVTLAIAAAGAAMVRLLGDAHEPRTPTGTAWLLGGAVALGLLALIPTERALVDAERLGSVYRPLRLALAGGAAAAIGAAWGRPAPWLLALLLVAILAALWGYAVSRFLRAGAWGDARPAPESG